VDNLIMVAGIVPPIGYEAADPSRCQGHIFRRVRPSLVGINTRDALEEFRRKILSVNVLDGVDELVDAKMGGVSRILACGKQAEPVVEFSAPERNLFGLLWLACGRRRLLQAYLGLCGFKPWPESVPENFDPGTDAL
jgi:hypothetical protein